MLQLSGDWRYDPANAEGGVDWLEEFMLPFRRSKALAIVAAVVFVLLGLSGNPARAADVPAVKLIIVKAEYGNLPDGKTADVTEKVKGMAKDNSLNVEASKSNFGPSPDKGACKLKVSYTFDGIYRSKTVDEGETLDISTRLIIRKAVYGALPKGPMADVTEDVADMVRKNSLTVEANNERFGDTASGIVKKLRVDYTIDGVDKSMTVAENATLRISVKP